jgi:hypothetical protein
MIRKSYFLSIYLSILISKRIITGIDQLNKLKKNGEDDGLYNNNQMSN